ncbi:MAG: ABC transporter permease [Parvibaculaceae bacterium]
MVSAASVLTPGERKVRHSRRMAFILLAPAIAVYTAFLVAPVAAVLEESLRLYVPGRVGSSADAPYTFQNYLEFLNSTYFSFFWVTIKLSLVGALICTILALPLAYLIVRSRCAALRKFLLVTMIAMVFLSALVRVYAIQMTFGPTGLFKPLIGLLGLRANSRPYLEATVVAGLLHFMLPIATLTLLGTIKNINSRFVEAAQSLGASCAWAHLTITVPLSTPGLVGAFLIAFSGSISAFVVPMILGKGRVQFVSNLIYSRFNELANFPSGAALAILMLVICLMLVFLANIASTGYGRTS